MSLPIEATGGASPATAADRATREEIREAARGLEAALLRQMLTAMEKAQLEEGLFGKGPGAGAYQSTFELLLTEALAETEPFGLADRIADQLASGPDGPGAGNARQPGDSGQSLVQRALDLARQGGISFDPVPIYSKEGSSPGGNGR